MRPARYFFVIQLSNSRGIISSNTVSASMQKMARMASLRQGFTQDKNSFIVRLSFPFLIDEAYNSCIKQLLYAQLFTILKLGQGNVNDKVKIYLRIYPASDKLPSLTVNRRKNRRIPCIYWAAAIFSLLRTIVIYSFPLLFFWIVLILLLVMNWQSVRNPQTS